MPDVVTSVSQVALFKHMSADEILRLMSVAEELVVKEGDVLIHEGDPGDALYIVEQGSLVVSKDVGEGRQEFLSVIEAGEFFGEMALIDRSPRSASVTAIEKSRLHKIAESELKRYLEEEPQLAAKLYRNFALAVTGRLRRTTDMLRSLADESSAVRRAVDHITSEILSVVSHELRTPVAVIKGAADVLDGVPLTPEKQKKFLSDIHKHTTHLSELLDDIVQLADVQYRQVQVQKNPENMSELVDGVVAALTETATKCNVSVQVEFPPSLPRVPVHKGKMWRILHHLIDNGIKYNKEGGKVVVKGQVDQEVVPPQMIISIQDEGPGIPLDSREELFNCFRQKAGSMDTKRKAGLGLGLPLSRSLIQAHGGRMRMETPPEGGTIFSFTLPME